MGHYKKPQIHGHRGARGLHPENTLTAIQAAIDYGCDAIEVDLCVSKDNRIVVIHDPILSADTTRDSSGTWISGKHVVHQLTKSELQDFDVGRIKPGTDYHDRFKNQKPQDGLRIPTLRQFSDLIKDSPTGVTMNLELKSTPFDCSASPTVDHFTTLLADELVNLEIADRVFVQSFDWRLALAAGEKIPEIKIGFTTDQQPDGHPVSPISGKKEPWTDFNDLADFNNSVPLMVKKLGADVWSSNYLDIDQEQLRHAHALGLEVYVWTVNSVDTMKSMINLGVDAITTDYPDRLKQLLE